MVLPQNLWAGDRLDYEASPYTDPATGIDYRFVTNAHHLKAKEVTEIYKERWQIELFFSGSSKT